MKHIFIAVGVLVSFFLGRLSVEPKVIVETKTEKVYDFTQEPEKMQTYANTMGKILIDREDFDKKQEEIERKVKEAEERISKAKDEFSKEIYQKQTELRLRQHEYWETGYMAGLKRKLRVR